MFTCECGCIYAHCKGCECESHSLLDHIPLTTLKEALESCGTEPPFTGNHVYHAIVTSSKLKSILKILKKLDESTHKALDKKTRTSKSIKASLGTLPSDDKIKKAIAKLKRLQKKVQDNDNCDE